MRLSRLFMWGVVALAVLIGPTWGYALLTGPGRWFEVILAAGLGGLLYGLVGLLCATARERGRAPRLMLSGILLGAVATGGWVTPIAFDIVVGEAWRVLIWPTVWAVLVALIGIVLLPRARRQWWVTTRTVAIVLLALLAVHVGLAVSFFPASTGANWAEVYAYEDTAYRIGGVLALLAAAGLAVTLLGAWLPRLAGAPEVLDRRDPYRLRCPRCGDEQDAETGEHRCVGCGLRIRVEVAA